MDRKARVVRGAVGQNLADPGTKLGSLGQPNAQVTAGRVVRRRQVAGSDSSRCDTNDTHNNGTLLQSGCGHERAYRCAFTVVPLHRRQPGSVDFEERQVVGLVDPYHASFQTAAVMQPAYRLAFQLTGLRQDPAVGPDDRTQGSILAIDLHADGAFTRFRHGGAERLQNPSAALLEVRVAVEPLLRRRESAGCECEPNDGERHGSAREPGSHEVGLLGNHPRSEGDLNL